MDAEVIGQIERYAAWLEERLGPVQMPDTASSATSTTVVSLSTASPVRRRGVGVLAAAAVVLVIAGVVVVAMRDRSPSGRTASVSAGATVTVSVDATTGASTPPESAPTRPTGIAFEPAPGSGDVGTSVPSEASGTTAITDLAPGSWLSARTSPDGRQVLINLVGAAPFEAGDPCTAEYSATAEETAEQVSVVITGVRPSGSYACRSVGYLRSVTLDLVEPLGGRRVLALGEVRDVFDGADLATVGWMPASWSLRDEGSAGVSGWYRTWRPDRPADQSEICIPSTPGLRLLEQPADAPDPWQPEPGSEPVGEYDVNGATATLTTVRDRNASTLAWTIGGRSFELRTAQVCQGDPDVDVNTFLTIARNITPAQSSAASSGVLTLSVSNQSSTEDPIALEVTIDGFRAVAGEFAWEGGHNWIEHELPLTVGRHDITITAPGGITKRAGFEIPDNGQLWAVVNYWYAPAGATFSGTDRAIEFRADTERILFD